ncbi:MULTISPECIES: type II secretion system secretin GspD [unclassified Hydrogenobaculum]|uniref:type II secretion system secretin GspD n=1 Tax=unclassified Hydrogenobaculum TaxID=2622382 RepID=UPI0001C50AB1|nr:MULTISPECIES: type II secretion system secretin GspD [unclassified Hydrogenobaculum]AEF19926.1 type II and III secretion system protein [Hydrogenobaculum sp. 3684]AEG47211.1 type II and III secretion system protein [Hydrogenobaculum sp. SHO]AGG15860.1 type II secretion system protein D (GspD) [Hydrogenobaculum sp. HO]AGH94160.1 type II secretion system protein D (GspD) [Hydrogenobaculum sp. SN]
MKNKKFLAIFGASTLLFYSCAMTPKEANQITVTKQIKKPQENEKKNNLGVISEGFPTNVNPLEPIPIPDFYKKPKNTATAPPPPPEKNKKLDLSKVKIGTKEPVAINVQNMPLGDFVQYALGQVLKVPYFIDQATQNNKTPVTINMPVKLKPQDVLKLVLGLLEKNNVEVSEKGGALYLNAKPTNVTPSPPQEVVFSRKALNTFQTITQIVPLKYIDPNTAINLIHNIYHSSLDVQIFPKANALMMTGPGYSIKSLIDFLDAIDIPYMKNKKPVLLHLTYWSPQDFVKQISSILEGLNIPIAQNPNQPGVLFVPIDYLNSVMVIPPDSKTLKLIMYWDKKLDTAESAGTEEKAYIYKPRFTRATELVQALQSLYSITSTTTAKSGKTPTLKSSPVISPQEAAGQLNTLAGPSAYGNYAGMSPYGGMGSAIVPSMQGAVPTSNFNTGPEVLAFSSKDLRIAADDRTNTILIVATPTKYKLVRSLLQELDKPPKQVLIKTTIAEVTLTGSLQYGIEWYIQNRFKKGTYTVSTLGNLGVATSGGLVATYITDSKIFQALLNMFAQKNKVKILSTPTLLVLNNHPASIDVGTQVPVINSQATSINVPSTTGGAGIIQSVQYVNTGIILNVLPTIETNNLVNLNIYQEDSTAQPNNTSGINSPIILTRNINTTVVVPNGGTVILGGLISQQKGTGVSEIPILGDIPILGNLFKNTSINNTKTELIIMLTPYIITDTEEAQKITDEIKSELSFYKDLK